MQLQAGKDFLPKHKVDPLVFKKTDEEKSRLKELKKDVKSKAPNTLSKP